MAADEARATALPVVFVHGIRLNGSMWHPVVDQVAAGRPVATPDMPGHGARRGEPFTLQGAIEAVLVGISATGASGRALLVGLSMGGYLSLTVAGRHPDRVAGVVAIGCSTRPGGSAIRVYRTMARRAAAHPRLADRVTGWGFRRQLGPDVASAIIAGGMDAAVMPAVVDALAGGDVLADLGRYPGPVWLVNGGLDPFRAEEKLFLRACQDGRLQVWPGLNHLSCLGQTDRLVQLVNDACAVVEMAATASGGSPRGSAAGRGTSAGG